MGCFVDFRNIQILNGTNGFDSKSAGEREVFTSRGKVCETIYLFLGILPVTGGSDTPLRVILAQPVNSLPVDIGCGGEAGPDADFCPAHCAVCVVFFICNL